MDLLSIALSFALGEGLAAAHGAIAPLWPLMVVLTLLASLFGYGLEWRWWRQLAAVFAGMAIFMLASVGTEDALRASPWMRNARRHDKVVAQSSAVRCAFSRKVGIGMEHDRMAVSLNRAILLGERSRLPSDTRKIFVESGTIHVFAISGLHVMVVAKLLMVIAALCWIPMRFQGLVAMPAVWAYVVMIGAPASAVRAALMATFYFLAPLFYRRGDGVVSWSIAFLIMHIVSPRYIVDVGSQLSFAVMLAIVLTCRFCAGVGGLRAMLAVTFAAWAAGMPIAACAFGRITPGGMLANLVLLPTAGGAVLTGAIGTLIGFVCEPLARHFNNLSALFTNFMLLVAQLVARIPWANFEICGWGLLQCVEWYAALALSLWLAFEMRRYRKLTIELL